VEQIAATIAEAKPDVAGGMQLVFGRAFGSERSEYGNVILTRGRIAEWHVEPLPSAGEPRTILAVTIDVDGTQLIAYVTHLSAWGRFGARKRLQQARTVAGRVSRSPLPFVLMGDFNSEPRSEELSVFHSGEVVTSCFVDPVVTYRATRQCLDYIFVDPGWQIHNAQVVQRGPSDHWPLIAELERM